MPRSVPNYLTIDPTTGAVGADFTGHVHARGIDLDAAPLAGTSDNEIHWTAQPGGAVLGMVRTTDQTMSFQHANAGGNVTEHLLFSGGITPSMQLFVGAAPNTKWATLLDSDDKSSYARISNDPVNSRLACGYISAAGVAGGGTLGWTCARIGVGYYAVRGLSPAAGSGWIPICTSINGGSVTWALITTYSDGFDIQGYYTPTAAPVDFAVAWIAWGRIN